MIYHGYQIQAVVTEQVAYTLTDTGELAERINGSAGRPEIVGYWVTPENGNSDFIRSGSSIAAVTAMIDAHLEEREHPA